VDLRAGRKKGGKGKDMETKELELNLRQAFTIVNNEAKIVPPEILDSYTDEFFQKASPNWLIELAERSGVARPADVRHTARTLAQAEERQDLVQDWLTNNSKCVRQAGEKVRQLARVWGFGQEWGVEQAHGAVLEPGDRITGTPQVGLHGETSGQSGLSSAEVIDHFLRHVHHKGVKPDTPKTYKKHLSRFAQQFPILPLDIEVIMSYLDQFQGETGRHKRNQYDLLKRLYKHAERYFKISTNPFDDLDRPRATKKPIRTLSLEEVDKVCGTLQTDTERAVWQLLCGHGWRQIEVRRVTAGDVRSIRNGLILCRGKERLEDTPLLPETQRLLEQLANGLPNDEPVIRSKRIRAGSTQPLGEDGVSQLIQRLFGRVGISYKGHDLRRTFCSLVREASGDEFLAMRLARDVIPGINDRYINYSLTRLREDLIRYSPLRLVSQKRTVQAGEKPTQTGEYMVETGESRTPRPREAAQNILQA
jgi:integrase